MLTSLWSPAFMTHGTRRGHIKFHEGLNIILGADNGQNSIGKSTALLAVDYMFGGNTYENSDVIKHVGNHPVYAEFKFNDKCYRVERNTLQPDVIVRISHASKEKRVISLSEYRNWLQEKYALPHEGLSFRQAVSSFFRVHGKDNYNERFPLRGIRGNSNEAGIGILIKLFDRYMPISELNTERLRQRDLLATYEKAQSFNLLPQGITSTTEFMEAKALRNTLSAERDRLSHSNLLLQSEAEYRRSVEKQHLIIELDQLNAQRAACERKIYMRKLNQISEAVPTDADLVVLKTFFPEVELTHITEVERFHQSIVGILQEQLQDDLAQVEAKKQKIEEEIQRVSTEIQGMGPVVAYSQEFLQEYSDLNQRIMEIDAKIASWQKHNQYVKSKKRIDERYKRAVADITRPIQENINCEMKQLTSEYIAPHRYAPTLEIRSNRSYTFTIPDDDGTGTNYRGLVTYDLAVLRLTALPVLGHDSLIHNNMDNETLSGIISAYASQKDKQIFIALDRRDRVDAKLQHFVDDCTVLELSGGGNELFGRSWSRK